MDGAKRDTKSLRTILRASKHKQTDRRLQFQMNQFLGFQVIDLVNGSDSFDIVNGSKYVLQYVLKPGLQGNALLGLKLLLKGSGSILTRHRDKLVLFAMQNLSLLRSAVFEEELNDETLVELFGIRGVPPRRELFQQNLTNDFENYHVFLEDLTS